MKESKNGKPILPIVIIVLILAVAVAISFNLNNQRKKIAINKPADEVSVNIGDTPIGEYTVCYGVGGRPSAKLLSDYITNITGENITLKSGNKDDKYIRLEKGKENKITITDGNIVITGTDASSLRDETYVFANTYLGYAFAGESREHVIENVSVINIPLDVYSCDTPWMTEREPIVCLWETNNPRGIYNNQAATKKCELLSYSDDQLYNYVKMMKYCGYTGIQVTDMCSAWAAYGGWEFVQQRIRFMADAAHSLDMNFTLWVWGAEFNGYGWNDKDVAYYDNELGLLARDNPKAVETFEKYYSIYAKLADCSDRVIMHFNDPGCLVDGEDIGYYANLFKEKCMAVNPDIDFGVNCYTYQIDLEKLEKYTGQDITVYSGMPHTDADLEEAGKFRIYAASHNMKLGIWSWNLTENEIDQIAEMNVNDELIKDCYTRMKTLDQFGVPTYYSEMDSYHLTNIFSHYVAGRLQQDPDLDEKELLKEISVAVVGADYADDLVEALTVIEDARTGSTWEEFKPGYGEYILESDSYPAKELAERCDISIAKTEEMIKADLKTNTIPLPVSTGELLQLLLPHLYEIRDFAHFRVELDKAYKAYENGVDVQTLSDSLALIDTPVSEYDTIVGSWGGVEARAQYNLIVKFCEETGAQVPHNELLDYYRKQRMYGELVDTQSKNHEKVLFDKERAFQGGNAFGLEETSRLVDELISDGLLKTADDGKIYLTDWERYTYGF